MSLSTSPCQSVGLELLTREWGELLNNFFSTGTGDQCANHEQSIIYTHDAAMQSEGSHDDRTIHPNQAEELRQIISRTSQPYRSSHYASDAEFAVRLDQYLRQQSL
jgi:hypothetical protein